MKLVFRSLAIAVFCLCCAVQSKAFEPPPGSWDQEPNSCITVSDATVECLPDNQYKIHFKFSAVKAGTNFIRISQSGTGGSTFTYPFKAATQTVSGTAYYWQYPYKCFNIDVYDVLPNGKVVKCSSEVCVWVDCEGGFENGFGKDVVAGESTTTSLTLAPNPATDIVNVSVNVPSFDPASSIDLVDMTGNVVATLATGMAAGNTVIPADLPNIANGMYMVRMMHAEGMVVQQLQIVR